MERLTQPTPCHQNGEEHKEVNDKGNLLGNEPSSGIVESRCGRIHTEWDDSLDATPMGQLAYFFEFIESGKRLSNLIDDCPIVYNSNNAPDVQDVLGTAFLSVLYGHKRYAHINAIRDDRVNARLLGMSTIVSEDSVRAGIGKMAQDKGQQWLIGHIFESVGGLLKHPWVMDIDTTVKCIYGKQEGAEIGYNPTKPGRPSHVYHSYWVGGLRLCLNVELLPGKQKPACYGIDVLKQTLQRIPRENWPEFIRGDCDYGNERWMNTCEELGLGYLFKLTKYKSVKAIIALAQNDFKPALDGWDYIHTTLQLKGWSNKRDIFVFRRTHKKNDKPNKENKQLALGEQREAASWLIEAETIIYEYRVLVSNLCRAEYPDDSRLSTYSFRGDNENCYDELKNQWGWGGFTTQDIKRSKIMALFVALTYNWWRLFMLLTYGRQCLEAITSRPLHMQAVAILTRHQRQKTLTIRPSHAFCQQAKDKMLKISFCIKRVIATTEQLNPKRIWLRLMDLIWMYFCNNDAPLLAILPKT